MSIHIRPVVIAGGNGTRLWPLSRGGYPKQFISLVDDQSLFQQAVGRLNRALSPSNASSDVCVVGNEEHRFMILDQLREAGVNPAAVVLEPAARNTAPALTLAAFQALQSGVDPVLVVVPADQTIADESALAQALQAAVTLAAQGAIVVLGITPNAPETGYGYIRSEPPGEGASSARVLQFVEKPDLETAQRYLAEGCYSWNSGMFVLKASVWLDALEGFRPDIHQATQQAWATRTTDGVFVRPDKEAFKAIPAESVDYAVIERCPGSRFDIQVVPLDAGWNDLGAWAGQSH